MSSENLPSGPLPEDIETSVRDIMRDVGISVLKRKTLRKRLEAKYKIEFTSHSKAVEDVMLKLLMTREFQKDLAKAEKEHGPLGGRGKKRGASSSKEDAKRAKKEKKPDDYPKAAISAYMIFASDHREDVKEQNPDIKVTDVVRKLGEMWAAASDATKEKYKKLAEEDKKRFECEMAEYKQRGGEVFKRSSRKLKKTKDENAPKRALSGYMFFVADFRKEHTDMKATEVTKAAGAAWKSISEDKKKHYDALAEKDKERYRREKEERK